MPPGEIVSRDSVDVFALYDPVLASARQFILEHCSKRINVQDVVNATGTSRRKLEIAFRDHFQSTILNEIHRAKTARAKKLIEDTDLPLYKIATLSGFRDPHQMNRVFTRNKQQMPFEIKRKRN